MRACLRILLGLILTGLLALAAGADQPDPNPFMRLLKDPQGHPLALQTGIVGYRAPSGQTVDLVAAVHLGEPEYYQRLNALFKKYDAVLFELVVDEDPTLQQHADLRRVLSKNGTPQRPPPGPVPQLNTEQEPDTSPLSQAQLGLARVLGLDFQLDDVDYTARNFVHADMTAAELRAAMNRKGETPGKLLLNLLKAGMQNPTTVSDRELQKINVLALLTRDPTPEEQSILRRVLAENFQEMDKVMADLQGSALIAGRNQKALSVLKQQMGKGRKRLAIFYGAAHMRDLESHMVQDFKMKRTSQAWVTAWKLAVPATTPSP